MANYVVVADRMSATCWPLIQSSPDFTDFTPQRRSGNRYPSLHHHHRDDITIYINHEQQYHTYHTLYHTILLVWSLSAEFGI